MADVDTALARRLSGTCAVVGVAETELVKVSERGPRQLAVEAILGALADAGLTPRDLDGIVAEDEVTPQTAPVNEVAAALGIERSFSVHGPPAGSGQPMAPMLAAMAMAAGQGSVFVCYLALDFGRHQPGLANFSYTNEAGDAEAFEKPLGFVGTPLGYAMAATRYRHLFGLTDRQLGAVSTTIRRHGSLNPAAQLQREVSMEEYLSSPYIARPLRLLDCCLRTTGAGAFVMTSKERARDLRQPPVVMKGAGYAASTTSRRHHWTQRPEFPFRTTRKAAQRAFAMADVSPDEVQFAEIQDPYSIQVVLQLEDCGLCAPGEGASFVEDGRIALGGRLPVNTHGGQLSHGYLLAMTHVIEAVRQLRGECGVRQVVDAELGLVSGFGPGESTVLLLERG